MGGEFGWTQQQESKKEGYSYYYEGSLLSLSPSKRLVAIEEGDPNLLSVVKDNQLEKDSLSEKETLKNKSLGLYRISVTKNKQTEVPDMGAIMTALSRSVTGQIQPVFEQGESLLIPADEVIVGFKEKTSLSRAQKFFRPFLQDMGVLDIREHRKDTFILTIENPSNGRAFEVAKRLTTHDKVSFAEPNFIVLMVRVREQGSWNSQIKEMLLDKQFILAHTKERQNEIPLEVTAQSPSQWNTIASLNFESDNLPNGWSASATQGYTDAYWGPTTYQKHGGARSYYCAARGTKAVNAPGPAPVKMSAGLYSPIINLSSYEEVYLELWFYAKNEIAIVNNQPIPVDVPVVSIVDMSNPFNPVFFPLTIFHDDGDCTRDPTTKNGWRRFLYRVPPSLRTTSLSFWFLYVSNESNQFEGAYIDDIRIVGTSDVDTETLSDDTYSARQYELKNTGQIAGLVQNRSDMHIPEAWNLVSVSQDIVVAVIDEGVDLKHPDLNLITGYDSNGAVGGHARGPHGTNCAGNVGAIKDNGIGVAGTAPGIKIMPVYWGGTTADLASAIDVAVAHGARILSNSWGWVGAPSQDIKNAIMAALSAGRIVLVAAGNGPVYEPYTYDVSFPGNLTGTTDVICVGASSPTDEHKNASSSDGEFRWGSSYVGDGPDVVAPGTWSYTTDLTGKDGYNDGSAIDPNDATSADYTPYFGGTSSSTPKVAGIVALMLSRNPNLTPAQVKAILRNSADDIDAPGIDDRTGAGRVNAYAAVSAVTGANSPNVTYFKINNGASSTTSTTVKLNNTTTGDPTEYKASESSNFTDAVWQTYLTEPDFTLSAGNGTKTVYFKVKNGSTESNTVSDSIFFSVTNPTPTPNPSPTPGACTDPYEENDDFSTAYGPLTSGNNYTGKICSDTDIDYFKIITSNAGTITVNLSVSPENDYDIYLYDSEEGGVDSSQNGIGKPETINYFASTPGTYYIIVEYFEGDYGGTQTYSLSGTWPSTTSSPNVTYFKINNGAASTTSTTVKLNNTATGSFTHYMASESADFSGAVWQTYLTETDFTLSNGDGDKTVYFKVKNASGESNKVSDSIYLTVANPTPTPGTTPSPSPDPTPNPTPGDCTDDYEQNNDINSAYGPLSLGNSYKGKICSPDDVDYFQKGGIHLTQVPSICCVFFGRSAGTAMGQSSQPVP